MATPPKAPRARRIEVPGEIPGGGLPDADYASAFELTTPDARALTPAQWARGAFEGAPAPLRPVLLLGWTLVLGLRLGPRPSPDHVLGWPIRDAGPDSVTLEADSRLLAARV
ncbi:hypothetical protein ACEZCY_12535 [Streptacidiphilus sp. N1-12]|uniref:Uncharacterized protein n=2 Tax=Streptacidiphilus alkalitolerans TaxID=3342712 RepID=A0ABV6V8P5_9ACTN